MYFYSTLCVICFSNLECIHYPLAPGGRCPPTRVRGKANSPSPFREAASYFALGGANKVEKETTKVEKETRKVEKEMPI